LEPSPADEGVDRHGRVSKAVLLGPIPPFFMKTDDNPEGVDQSLFEGSWPPRGATGRP
jgi:hypothetical protein